MIDNPRIILDDSHKTFFEVMFYIFDEEYAIKKRFKKKSEVTKIATDFVRMFNDEKLNKELDRFLTSLS